MRGAHVRIVVLRKWFPPDDPLAAKIARLCILREDLLIEMHGVYTESITELDAFQRSTDGCTSSGFDAKSNGTFRRYQILLRTPEFSALLESNRMK